MPQSIDNLVEKYNAGSIKVSSHATVILLFIVGKKIQMRGMVYGISVCF